MSKGEERDIQSGEEQGGKEIKELPNGQMGEKRIREGEERNAMKENIKEIRLTISQYRAEE